MLELAFCRLENCEILRQGMFLQSYEPSPYLEFIIYGLAISSESYSEFHHGSMISSGFAATSTMQ